MSIELLTVLLVIAILVVFASGLPVSLPASDSNGRISTEVVVSAGTFAPRAPRWLDYTVMMRNDDQRGFSGSALALPDRGLSVVSDIDDTIKHTQVRDRREMLLNTFARRFVAVPGMADWMRRCSMADSSARLHYVSGGPIQLYPVIACAQTGEFVVAWHNAARTACRHSTRRGLRRRVDRL